MKNNLFKKSMSVFLSVLMLLSCWVWVPGEHNHASAASGTVNPTALTAIYNGSGTRGDSGKIVICSDGEAGNTTVGHIRFNISGATGILENATLTLNTGNHGGTLVSNCRVDIYPLSVSQCQATSGTYVVNNIATVYGGTYNAAAGVTNALNYYGLTTADKLGTVYQSTTGSHTIDVTSAVNKAKAAGQNEVCFLFIMPEIFNDGDGNSWSDTHINVSGTSLSYKTYDFTPSNTGVPIIDINTDAANTVIGLNTDVTTIHGSFESDADYTSTANYDAVYHNVLYTDGPTTIAASATSAKTEYGSSFTGSNGVTVYWYHPTATLLYDGDTTDLPRLGVAVNTVMYFTGTWSRKSVNRLSYVSSGGNGFNFTQNWHGSDGRLNFQWMWHGQGELMGYTSTVVNEGMRQTLSGNSDNHFYANLLKFTDTMGSNEYYRSATPTFAFYGDNESNAKTITATSTDTIYIINYVPLKTAIQDAMLKLQEIKDYPAKYSTESVAEFVAAAKALVSAKPNNYINQSRNDVTGWASAAETAVNNYYKVNLELATYDVTYENMFSFSSWANSASSVIGTPNKGTMTYDVDAGTITVNNNGANTQDDPHDHYTSYGFGNSHYNMTLVPGETYTFEYTTSGGTGDQVHIFFYDDNGNAVANPANRGSAFANAYGTGRGTSTITFTAPENATKAAFRFGSTVLGDSITFSNIFMYSHTRGDYADIANWTNRPNRTVFDYAQDLGTTLEVPERPGYTFNGWWVDSINANGTKDEGEQVTDGNGTVVDTLQSFGIAQDWVLYSEWTEHKYNIAFNANGGSGSTAGINNVLYSADTKLTANGFSRTGYTFTGWNTKEDGTGTAIADGATVSKLTATNGATVTLYAQWSINKYTVTWKNEDGTVLETDTDAEYGTTPTYDGETPTKPADAQYTYTFKGWSPEVTEVTGDVTYTAVYEKTQNSFTVTWKFAGGTEKTETYAYGATPTAPANTASYNDANGHHIYSWPALSEVTGNVTYEESVSTTAHNFNQQTATDTYKATDASCTAKAIYYYSCACGEKGTTTFEFGELAAHTPGAAATCTSAQTCTVCGAELAAQLAHTYNQQVATDTYKATDASCTAKATYYYSCVCGAKGTTTFEYGELLDHKWDDGTVTKAATCITPGVKTFTCSACGSTKTEAVSATGVHIYGEWSQFNNGTTHRRTCTADVNCTAFEEEAHSFNGTIRQMVGNNYHQYKCEKCDAYGVGTSLNVGEACFEEGTTFTQIENDANHHKETCKCGREKNDAHAWEGWVADPENKADNQGKMSNTCSECGYKKTSDCTYSKTSNYKAPTCTENGYQGWKCLDCGNGYTEILAATGHTFGEVTEAKVATCLAAGNKAYKQCTECNLYFADNAETNATDGKADATSFVIAQLAHSYTGAIKSDDNGKTATHSFKCVNGCNEYGGAVAHTWNSGEVTTAATCITGGTKTYTCTVEECGGTYTEAIAATGHKFGTTTAENAATCVATGNEAYKQCTVCSKYFAADAENDSTDAKDSADAFTTNIDDTNHVNTKGYNQEDATCLDKGYKAGTYCEDCAKWISGHEEIPATNHANKEHHVKVDATCIATGTIEYWSCPDCNKTFSDEECTNEVTDLTIAIDTDAHDWNDWTQTIAPTCSEKGEDTRTCKFNGDHKETREVAIDETAHKYGDWIQTKAPTCSEKGEDTRTCEYNEEHKDTREVAIDADNHNYSVEITARPELVDGTWTKGTYTYTCSNGCGSIMEEDALRADYSALESAVAELNELKNNDKLNADAIAEIDDALAAADNLADNLVTSEQPQIDKLVNELLKAKADVEQFLANIGKPQPIVNANSGLKVQFIEATGTGAVESIQLNENGGFDPIRLKLTNNNATLPITVTSVEADKAYIESVGDGAEIAVDGALDLDITAPENFNQTGIITYTITYKVGSDATGYLMDEDGNAVEFTTKAYIYVKGAAYTPYHLMDEDCNNGSATSEWDFSLEAAYGDFELIHNYKAPKADFGNDRLEVKVGFFANHDTYDYEDKTCYAGCPTPDDNHPGTTWHKGDAHAATYRYYIDTSLAPTWQAAGFKAVFRETKASNYDKGLLNIVRLATNEDYLNSITGTDKTFSVTQYPSATSNVLNMSWPATSKTDLTVSQVKYSNDKECIFGQHLTGNATLNASDAEFSGEIPKNTTTAKLMYSPRMRYIKASEGLGTQDESVTMTVHLYITSYDKGELRAAVNAAEAAAYNPDYYVAVKYEAYQSALKAAKEVLGKAETTQDEVDEATEALNAAVGGLERAEYVLTLTHNIYENGDTSTEKTGTKTEYYLLKKGSDFTPELDEASVNLEKINEHDTTVALTINNTTEHTYNYWHKHVYGEFSHVEDTTTHEKTCEVGGCTDKITENCTAGEWVTDKNATCVEEGSKYKNCTVCTYELEREKIPMISHNFGGDAINAGEGVHHYKCQNQISTDGTKCSTYGVVINGVHTPDETEACSGGTATCTEKATCSECSVEYGTALGHVYDETKGTDNNNGTHTVACTRCAEGTEGHTKVVNCTYAEGVVTAPTCTKDGYTTHTCTICSYSYTDAATGATGHTFGNWTANDNGTHTRVCTVCTDEEGRTETAGCTYGEWAKYDDTHHRQYCTACKTNYNEGTHVFSGDIKKLDGENNHQYKCAQCEAYGVGTQIDAKEACFGEGTVFDQITGDAVNHKETCKCGREQNDSHTYSKWEVVNGNNTRKCSECYYLESVAVYTVKWVDGDGNVIETDENVVVGTMPSYDGETPIKAATAQYTYTFKGWDKEIVAVTGDATYTAEFDATVNEYTVKFVNEDGTELQSGKVAYGETPAYTGETPTKAADAQYTYTFSGWTPAIENVTGEATYTAQFDATVNKYTVTFVNEDGTELQSGKVEYGATPVYSGETPTKAATAQYTYTFKDWTPAIEKVTGEATYTATFTETVNKYTVTFVNEDGTELQSGKVAYGETPVYSGETPTKEATTQYTYTFKGWDKEFVAVTGDVTYTAEFDATVNEYTVTFVNEDGTELQSGKVAYGETPVYSGETPTKAATAQYTYTFKGWTPAIAEVTGEATYTAEFDAIVNEYTVEFVNEDGTELQSGKVAYGETPAYTGETPTKAATAQYTYTFKGWDKEFVAVTGDVTYTAEFDATVNEYTVKFVNEDGTELQSGEVAYGETPVYSGETPTKEATAQYTYTFKGWTPAITEVIGDATYTATFTETVNKYTVTFVNEDGTELQSGKVAYGETPVYSGETPTKEATAQYTYTFKGWTPAIAEVTGEATYTATYTATVNKYIVTWIIDGAETTEEYEYGATPVHADPTKAADAQYTYIFSGWTPAIAEVTGEATYTAEFDAIVNEYTIKFVNEDGTELQSGKVAYGETPVYSGETPTKAATAQYTYTFKGWTPAIAEVTGEATYTAEFDAIVNEYTIKFVNEDGTELQSATLDYGSQFVYSSTDPEKNFDDNYHYTFAGWKTEAGDVINPDSTSFNVIADAIYTATYSATAHSYTYAQNIDGLTHTGTCVCDKTVVDNCAGGTADCENAAVCSTCNKAYGESLGHNYDKTKTDNNLTRPKLVDGVWTKGYYTYTCKNNPAHTTKEEVDRADYTGYETARDNLEALLDTDITDEAKEAIEEILDKNKVDDNLIESEQDILKNAEDALEDALEQYKGSLNTYTVTFIIEGAETTVTVISGGSATAPSNPTKAYDDVYHYEFTGWDTQFAVVTSDLTVTAQFKSIEHTYTHTDKDDQYHTDACTCGYSKDVKHTETSEVTTKASCYADGVRTYTCSVCYGTRTETIAKREHNIVDTTVALAPTCSATGTMNQKCNHTGSDEYEACDYTTTRVMDKVADAHKAEADYTVMQKATCEADGYKAILCEYCDTELSTKTIAKREHTYKDNGVQTAATCKTEGVMNTICTNEETDTHAACAHESTRAIEKIAHSYTGEYKWNNSVDPKTHSQKCVNGCEEYGNETQCTFDTAVTEPNCFVNGYTTYTCTVCTNSYQSDYTTREHVYVYAPGNGTSHEVSCKYEDCTYSAIENCSGGTATCTEKAICENCNTAWGEKNSANHTGEANVVKNDKAATCTEEGYTGDIHWSCCDALKTKGTVIPVDADAHTGEANVVKNDKAATCTEEGYTGDIHWSCCDALKTKGTVIPVDADAHTGEANVVKNDKAATCTEEGYTGDIHWSCCDALKTKGTVIPVDAAAHTGEANVVKNDKAATCTEEGYTGDIYWSCCDALETKGTVIPVDADAHTGEANVVKNDKAATCTEEGYTGDIHWSCCDALETKGTVIEKASHTEEFVPGTPATCDNEGLTDGKKCSVCDEVLVEQEVISALGHDYEGVVTTEPTCGKEGLKTYICKNDASHGYTEILPALQHKYGEWTLVSGNCIDGATYKRVCANCGDEETKTETGSAHTVPVNAKGEPIYDVIAEPTCTQDGFYVYTCAKCHAGKIKITAAQDSNLSKTGHKWIITSETDSNGWVIDSPATCEREGSKYRVCENCRDNCINCEGVNPNGVQTAIIAKTGHTDKDHDGVCDDCKLSLDHSGGDCRCICHKDHWLMRLIYKILRFFWKLFKIGRICNCGYAHY